MSIAIRAEAVTKTYEDISAPVQALRAVNLEVADGEFVAVMGPSGSGKSTLLHVLGGISRPTSGRVLLAGRDLAAMGDEELAECRRQFVGFVFQAYNLVPVLTAEENVGLPCVIAGQRRRDYQPRVDALLEQTGLSPLRRRYPSELSGGEQQRVAIARALVMSPTVLLADEPTGNLDSRMGFDLLRMFQQLHQQGQTIVLVTHDVKIASGAQRVVSMRDGQIVREQDLRGESSLHLGRLLELDS